jgi:hypothetical protein
MAEPHDLLKARLESAALLNLGDVERLSPADALRCDLISTLRLAIDGEQATVLDGGSADLAKLITATENLIRLLPGRELPAPESQREDPREVMFKIYMQMRERGEVPPEGWHQHRIDKLELENERLRAQLVAGGLAPALPPGGSSAITPPTCDIVPPSERAECDAGVKPGPDDWRAQRSTTVIEGKANPPAAGAPAKPVRPAWEDWLAAGGYGGPGFDRWADNRR